MSKKFTKAISVFLSSTFADMQAERDYLKNVVLPKVEDRFNDYGIKLNLVDLRWGIDTSKYSNIEEKEQEILSVCFDEIRLCYPFFIGLIGDRYGWIPPSNRIKEVVKQAPVQNDFSKIDYNCSKSVTELEIEFGVLNQKSDDLYSSFYFRNALPYDEMPPEVSARYNENYNLSQSQSEREANAQALSNLKDKIYSFSSINANCKISAYDVTWNKHLQRVCDLEDWGRMIEDDLSKQCLDYIGSQDILLPKNWFEEVKLQNNRFFSSLSENIVNTNFIKKLFYFFDDCNRGIIFSGHIGSGKSTLISFLKSSFEEVSCFTLSFSADCFNNYTLTDLIKYFIIDLSIYLKHEKSWLLNNDNFHSEEYLINHFHELLLEASDKDDVVILIDALHLFENAQKIAKLNWLPTKLPKNVRVICSVAEAFIRDDSFRDVLSLTSLSNKRKLHTAFSVIEIPNLTRQEAREIILDKFSQNHKSISEKVLVKILDKKRHLVKTNPRYAYERVLWISSICEYLLKVDSYDLDKIQKRSNIFNDFPISEYFSQAIDDLSSVSYLLLPEILEKSKIIFNSKLVEYSINYILCSKEGITEKDLSILLKYEGEVFDTIEFANIRRWLKGIIFQRDNGAWDFTHSCFRKNYDSLDDTIKANCHENIIKCVDENESSTLLSEVFYHCLKVGDFEKAFSFYGLFGPEHSLTKKSSIDLHYYIRKSKKNFNKIADNYSYCLDKEFEQKLNIVKNLNFILLPLILDDITFKAKGIDFSLVTLVNGWDDFVFKLSGDKNSSLLTIKHILNKFYLNNINEEDKQGVINIILEQFLYISNEHSFSNEDFYLLFEMLDYASDSVDFYGYEGGNFKDLYDWLQTIDQKQNESMIRSCLVFSCLILHKINSCKGKWIIRASEILDSNNNTILPKAALKVSISLINHFKLSNIDKAIVLLCKEIENIEKGHRYIDDVFKSRRELYLCLVEFHHNDVAGHYMQKVKGLLNQLNESDYKEILEILFERESYDLCQKFSNYLLSEFGDSIQIDTKTTLLLFVLYSNYYLITSGETKTDESISKIRYFSKSIYDLKPNDLNHRMVLVEFNHYIIESLNSKGELVNNKHYLVEQLSLLHDIHYDSISTELVNLILMEYRYISDMISCLEEEVLLTKCYYQVCSFYELINDSEIHGKLELIYLFAVTLDYIAYLFLFNNKLIPIIITALTKSLSIFKYLSNHWNETTCIKSVINGTPEELCKYAKIYTLRMLAALYGIQLDKRSCFSYYEKAIKEITQLSLESKQYRDGEKRVDLARLYIVVGDMSLDLNDRNTAIEYFKKNVRCGDRLGAEKIVKIYKEEGNVFQVNHWEDKLNSISDEFVQLQENIPLASRLYHSVEISYYFNELCLYDLGRFIVSKVFYKDSPFSSI